jgi:hypothetical protein
MLSHKALYLIAVFIWVVGVVVCALKGAEYLQTARDEGATKAHVLVAMLVGVGSGLCIGQLAFAFIAKKTIDRIEMLDKPYWHASYNWKFYAFLTFINVTVNMLIKYVFHTKISYLIFAAMDLQVSVSLGYSLYVFFFNWKTFGLKNRFATGLGEQLLYSELNPGDDYERNFRNDSPGGQNKQPTAEMEDSDPLSMRNILVHGLDGDVSDSEA